MKLLNRKAQYQPTLVVRMPMSSPVLNLFNQCINTLRTDYAFKPVEEVKQGYHQAVMFAAEYGRVF